MRLRLAVAFAFSALASAAYAAPARPAITGISHIAVYTSNAAAAEHYYVDILGTAKASDPENPHGVRYMVNATQFVEVLPLPAGQGVNRLDHTAYNTADAEALRAYLAGKGYKVPAKLTRLSDGAKFFTVHDPEGNAVEFVQPSAHATMPAAPNRIGKHIIHVGMLVHNREKENSFYIGLLGFRPYWFGGMVDNRTDWVSMQTPQSRDWLEYMLTYSGKSAEGSQGVPADISQHELGVLDHFSIGVVSVDDAFNTLKAANRLGGVHDPHTNMGKDGKRQFNMYDPDGIRAELMNFKATEKPCCSDFTAQDPDPAE